MTNPDIRHKTLSILLIGLVAAALSAAPVGISLESGGLTWGNAAHAKGKDSGGNDRGGKDRSDNARSDQGRGDKAQSSKPSGLVKPTRPPARTHPSSNPLVNLFAIFKRNSMRTKDVANAAEVLSRRIASLEQARGDRATDGAAKRKIEAELVVLKSQLAKRLDATKRATVIEAESLANATQAAKDNDISKAADKLLGLD